MGCGDRLRVQSGHLHAAFPGRLEEVAKRIVEGLGQEQDDQCRGQRRHGVKQADTEGFEQAEQKVAQAVAERLGEREARQHVGQPEIGDAQPQEAHQQLREPLHQQPAMTRPAKPAGGILGFDDFLQMVHHQHRRAANQPQQKQRNGGGQYRQSGSLKQHHRTMLLACRLQRGLHLTGRPPPRFVERELLVGVQIPFQDVEENRLPNPHTDSTLAVNRERRHFDRLLHLVRRQSIEAGQRPADARLGGHSHQRRSEGDDRPEVVVEGRFPQTGRVGENRRNQEQTAQQP